MEADHGTLDELEDDGDAGRFSIVLGFAGAACPNCNEFGEPGPCGHCGTEVPATTETNELVEARRKALGPLADEARQFVAAFDDIPDGRIPVSTDQFLAATADAEVLRLVGSIPDLGNRLAGVDFDDPRAVGRGARRAVMEHLSVVRELLGVCTDLALFEPSGPAAELREIAIGTGAYGAQIVEALVRAITAPTVLEARAAERDLQALLDGFPFTGRMDELLPELELWSVPDLDARIGLALDAPGIYTDDFGFLDPGRVFGVYADHDQPLLRLAERAREYFSHLLDGPPNDLGDEALLVMPAVTLAALDRPFLAHRVARMTTDLMSEAWATDPTATQALVDRTTANGPLLFAAAARIQKSLQLLVAGERANLVDDELLVKQLLDTYQELAEAHFRTAGWLVLEALAIRDGGAPSGSGQPPMLTELEQRLASAGHELADAIAGCTDSALRNASAHSQYRWDAETGMLLDLRADRQWSAEQLEYQVDRLVGGIVGIDAGYCVSLLDSRVELRAPAWLTEGEAPYATSLLATALFGAYGFEVFDIAPDGSEIAIVDALSADVTRLIPPLGGVSNALGRADDVRVLDAADGRVVLTLEGGALREALSAKDEVRDLAIVSLFARPMIDSGREPQDALIDVAALQVAVICLVVLDEVAADVIDVDGLTRLSRRLRYAHRVAQSQPGSNTKAARKVLDKIGRAQVSAFAASRGDQTAFNRLTQQLASFLQWIESRGISWPPV